MLGSGDKSSQAMDIKKAKELAKEWEWFMKKIDLNNLPKGYKVFDAADYLETEEDIAYFLEAACEDNDPVHISRALAAVARARGMSKIARKSGVSRATLYNALSVVGTPDFTTIVKVIGALGLKLRIA